jgi:hypothetical protein
MAKAKPRTKRAPKAKVKTGSAKGSKNETKSEHSKSKGSNVTRVSVKAEGEGGPELVSIYRLAVLTLSNDVQLVMQGLIGLLAVVANSHDDLEDIAVAGGNLAVLSAMVVHADIPIVQAKACSLISHLAEDASNEHAICQENGLSFILRAMTTHEADFGVQEAAIGALDALSTGDEDFQLIIKEGGRLAIVKALEKFGGEEHKDFQEKASKVLSRVLSVKAEGGGGPGGHPITDTEPEPFSIYGLVVTTLSSDVELAMQGLNGLLAVVADSQEDLGDIAVAGGNLAVLSAMVVHVDIPIVQAKACSLISHLAGDASSEHAICQENGLSLILQAMTTHEADFGVQEAAIHALNALCRDDEDAQIIKKEGGRLAIVKALEKFGGEEHKDFQEKASKVLSRVLTPEN